MKNLIIVLLFSLILGCEGSFLCPDMPAPKSRPDDTSTYDGSGGYKSVTYTYYCLSGKYQSITWTRIETCGIWKKSTYTSSCI